MGYMKQKFLHDTSLNQNLIKGDEKAYVYLLEQYHKPLSVYVFGLIKDKDRVEDIVQNVFVKTWEQRQRLNVNLPIKSFLYKLAYNEFIDQYRKHKAITALEKVYFEALEHIVEQKNREEIKVLFEKVKLEMENLPPKCQKVFMLSKQEGLTNVEISEYLNVSVKTVEAQITKAFSILRKKLVDKIKINLLLIFGR